MMSVIHVLRRVKHLSQLVIECPMVFECTEEWVHLIPLTSSLQRLQLNFSCPSPPAKPAVVQFTTDLLTRIHDTCPHLIELHWRFNMINPCHYPLLKQFHFLRCAALGMFIDEGDNVPGGFPSNERVDAWIKILDCWPDYLFDNIALIPVLRYFYDILCPLIYGCDSQKRQQQLEMKEKVRWNEYETKPVPKQHTTDVEVIDINIQPN
jgi:hypothetical protein